MTPTRPDLSVVVPTHGRPDALAALLAGLSRQTLDPGRFEVIAVDDGSPEPVAVAQTPPFALELLRQRNAGPGAARNRGIERCRAPLTLILNDDALPAPDLLERHLAIHADAPPCTAVLGAFPFSQRALRHPFVQLLAGSDLLFDFPHLRDGARLPWQFFWTCNLSLPTEALREVGGFDGETFREAVVEDVELGYRLEQRGFRVLFRADARCEHDHALDSAAYFRRQQRLGVNLARMYRKHGDARVLWVPEGERFGAAHLAAMQATVEAYFDTLAKLRAKLQALERDATGEPLSQGLVDQVRPLVRKLGAVQVWRGVLQELEGHDPGAALERGPSEGLLTSVVVVSHDALERTRRCVESLRAARDPRFPTELLVVDNGSRDGSAEWLADQDDLVLIANERNAGAPRARNQALGRARGARIAFLDNDVLVPPGWLERMLFHAEVDGRSGCVGALADRAAHGQQIPYEGGSDPAALADFAARHAEANRRRARPASLLASFCMLVRREVVEAIGGFDERFSPWGFEDDDFALRAGLAGFRNRVALDVFVRHESYSGPRLERHARLLERNWRRFAEKWSGSSLAAYGDYKALGSAMQRPRHPLELFCALEGQEPPEAELEDAAPSAPRPRIVPSVLER